MGLMGAERCAGIEISNPDIRTFYIGIPRYDIIRYKQFHKSRINKYVHHYKKDNHWYFTVLNVYTRFYPGLRIGGGGVPHGYTRDFIYLLECCCVHLVHPKFDLCARSCLRNEGYNVHGGGASSE